jgi:SAM-dependent methyltransferase
MTPEFYAETVHCHILENHQVSLEKYRKRIRRELAWMGIEPQELKNLTCLDVGTGYQALILAELGCRQVFHRDISHRQVQWLQSYCRAHGISVIQSEQADLMGQWDVPEPLDLSLVVGVYHHLTEPPRFLRSLWERTSKGGKIFLRCYRSGTWSRWLTAHLRTLSRHLDPGKMLAEHRQQCAGKTDGQFLGDMLDDLFVPEWKCFLPRQFREDAELLGMTVRTEDGDLDLNLGARDENFRVLITKNESQITLPAIDRFSTRESIDQLSLDSNAYPQLEEAARRFKSLAEWAKTMDQDRLASKLLTLYRLVRTDGCHTVRGYDGIRDPVERCEALLEILRRWCSEEKPGMLLERGCLS